MSQDILFTPLEFRNLTVKNRILRSSMTGKFDNYDGSGTHARINWELKFARGGVGAIVSAHCPVSIEGRIMPNVAMLDHDDKIPFWRSLIREVHKHDCKYLIQLSHAGRQRDIPGIETREDPGLSSTSKADDINGLPARAMTIPEVKQVVQQFRQAARRAREAGADGIETHSCNGYLFTQFLSPNINDRRDEYGGSLENRARLLLEVIREIRAEVGRDFHFQVKLNGADYGDTLYPWRGRGNTVEDYLQVARWCEAEGVDALVVSAGDFTPHPKNPAGEFAVNVARRTYEAMINSGKKTLLNYLSIQVPLIGDIFRWWWARRRGPLEGIEGILLPLAERFKPALKIPVLVTGGFQTAPVIRRAIAEGRCDGVTIARPLIANPDLVNQFARGLDRPPLPCTYCNQCLTHALQDPLGCYELARFDNDWDKMLAEIMSVYEPRTFTDEQALGERAGT
jgi:2,4-dienoyl-CoA reductase (NADPH2)